VGSPVKLEVDSVSKGYQIPVLDAVSFQAAEGEFVCLLGPNGCGKTTLLRIIGGLEAPTAGEVRLDGRPVRYAGRAEFHVGVVFQEDRLLPWTTLEDNVALVLKPLGRDAAARRETARRYLRFVGLQGFEGYYPSRVSGGMRQRAAIARALAIEPDVLLMDEPFGALDAQNRRIMQAEIKRIWAETGKTIVFVTHSIEEAVAIGTTLVMLSARPARVRELIRIERDGATRQAYALVDHLNQVIMEEVIRQQGEASG
jgi:ABC-type nitrate/sulfonate/bicarbonate transport system ATPase subunit